MTDTSGLDEQWVDGGARTTDDEDASRDTADIRVEIQETRAELAQTVEAIEEKLRPRAVVARAAEKVKDTAAARVQELTNAAGETVRTAGSAAHRAVARTRESAGGIMGMMRDNPVPAALVAVGAGWLLANARRNRRHENDDMDMDMEVDADRYWGDANTYRRRALDMSSVRRTGQQAQAQLQRMTSNNALLVGAGALLIGAAFGLALPETEPENALMGDARDSLVDRAQQAASDAAERLQSQASSVADAAGEMADSLSPRSQG